MRPDHINHNTSLKQKTKSSSFKKESTRNRERNSLTKTAEKNISYGALPNNYGVEILESQVTRFRVTNESKRICKINKRKSFRNIKLNQKQKEEIKIVSIKPEHTPINLILKNYKGLAIKQLRKSQGFTLKTLGLRTGISEAFLSEIENGKKSPSINSLELLSGVLNVPTNYFDLKAMILGKDKLSPAMQAIAKKLEPLVDELTKNYSEKSDVLEYNVNLS